MAMASSVAKLETNSHDDEKARPSAHLTYKKREAGRKGGDESTVS